MTKSIAAKMGIKPGSRTLFIGAPADAVDAMALPELDLKTQRTGDFAYIHFFATSQQDLHAEFPVLRNHLLPTGMLWISWPKAGQQRTDLTLTKVIEIGYEYGLVESKTLSINATWSAIKFTHPIKGKVYHNSYGTLKA
jgi:hypothetical protein